MLRIQKRLILANIIRCSRLRLRVGYFIYFKFTCVSSIVNQSFLFDVFNGCSLVKK